MKYISEYWSWVCLRFCRVTRGVFFEGPGAGAIQVLVLVSDGVSDDRQGAWFEAMQTRQSGIYIICVNKTIHSRRVEI